MRILATGGHGFIGSEFVRQALAAGHDILNVDCLTYAASGTALAEIENSPAYSFAKVDICDAAGVERCFETFQPDAVVHLAAESHVDRSITGPGTFLQTNIIGTFTLLQAARNHCDRTGKEAGFRFLHVSTDEVFGSLGADGRFSELSPYQPNSPYSASKASSDHLVRAWAETYGLPVLITNCSNNYGPYQFPEKLIPLSILNAIKGKPIGVYGQGNNIRDWLHVRDHVRGILAVLKAGTLGETYCIGGHGERTNLQVVNAICDHLDAIRPGTRRHRDLIRFIADRPGHDFRYAIDAGKIATELGWQPEHDFEAGIAQTVEWYLAREDWWRPLLSAPVAQYGDRQ